MGIKTTYNIKRDVALQIIVSRVYGMHNDQLAEVLETFEEESHFRNYAVFDELPDDDCEYVIEGVNDF